jgi:3-hydroxyisobutyrate dehydrogenase-like beta-hydroxyacid dehydrogenase
MAARDGMPVGLIGLGLMGTALAGRLLGGGFAVLGFDVDAAKGAALEKQGGRAARSIAEVGRACRRILLAVYDTDQVEAVLEGEGGLASAVPTEPQRLVLCISTCDPDRLAALAPRLAQRGIAFLEAPISGTSDQVARGDGTGLLGGDPAAIAASGDILDAICARRFTLGAVGDGGKAKLAINLILGINRAALAEGLAFAERVGLDPRRFLEVARQSAAYSQVMDTKGEKMLQRDYAPQGRMHQSRKDAQLMLDQARRHGMALPLTETHAALLDACIVAGGRDWDNSAVIEAIRARKPDGKER